MILTYPSLMCSFNRGNIEGTNSSKICVWCLCVYVLCLRRDWFCGLTWQRVYIYIRRVLKYAFAYDLSSTVLRWPSYYYYYPPCISAIPGDPRGKTPMHRWQFCGQRLHPQRYCHWNTGCKYMTEGPVVNHSFILPTISHHWNTGCQKSRCQPHLYWLID